MKRLNRRLPSVSLGLSLANLAACSVQADFFSWEVGAGSGNFTDVTRWHGPNFPAHTRFPGAGDDASVDRGPITITVAGNQATRELLTGAQTLDILGAYNVAQLSAYGAPLTVTGPGDFDVDLWLMGDKATVGGGTTRVGTLQPLGSSPPSQLVVRDGASVISQALDRSRGGLKVTVEGAGSTWKHGAGLPFMQLALNAGGRAEAPSTSGVFVEADGANAIFSVAGLFQGYGRIANGARVECTDGTATGQTLTLDGGVLDARSAFINDGIDMTVQNGGVLKAANVKRGQFGSVTVVTGAGSRFEVLNVLNHLGSLQMKSGGQLQCGRAELSLGSLFADNGGRIDVAGDLFSNSGINLQGGSQLKAANVFLADTPGRAGGLSLRGAGTTGEVAGALAIGQYGDGNLTLDNQATLESKLAGLGIFGGSIGRAALHGAFTTWTLHPGGSGGALVIGDAGTGELTLDTGAVLKTTAPGDVALGRGATGNGKLRITGFGSAVQLHGCTIQLGGIGVGAITVADAGTLEVDSVHVGNSGADNRLRVEGADSILGVIHELVVGTGGRGTLEVVGNSQAIFGRLAIGRESKATNTVRVMDPGTKLSSSGRIDVGEQNGRGHLEMSNLSQARPAGGLSVGIYDGSSGTLRLDQNSFIVTDSDAIFGGGAASVAEGSIRGEGSLSALDVLLFARISGSSTVEVTGPFSSLIASRDIQVGFDRGLAGTTTLRIADGAYASAGQTLLVGVNGLFIASGARVKVGTGDFPTSDSTVRIGPGGRLAGSGTIVGHIEVAADGKVTPGASPGTLTVDGNFAQTAGGILEVEISGTGTGTEYDVLHATGSAVLGGTLSIRFINGFSPRAGQKFGFLTADKGLAGAFAKVEVSGVAAGFSHRLVATGPGGLSLEAVNDGAATSAPLLAILRNGASVTVSWPAPGTWTLESTAALSGNWLPVGTAPAVQNGRSVVTLPASSTGAYFRLRL